MKRRCELRCAHDNGDRLPLRADRCPIGSSAAFRALARGSRSRGVRVHHRTPARQPSTCGEATSSPIGRPIQRPPRNVPGHLQARSASSPSHRGRCVRASRRVSNRLSHRSERPRQADVSEVRPVARELRRPGSNARGRPCVRAHDRPLVERTIHEAVTSRHHLDGHRGRSSPAGASAPSRSMWVLPVKNALHSLAWCHVWPPVR